MIVKLDVHPAMLIQTIRINQALMEAGVTVSINPAYQRVYNYLGTFFDIKYTLKDGPIVDIESDHATPFVRVGQIQRDLLFPESVFKLTRKFWGKRSKKFLFMGLTPPFRKQALKKWQKTAEIISTTNGRMGASRYWDENYYEKTGSAEFILCPNGGYPWSYRFFEAILCGATPVVETEVPCYEGFYYHRWNDTDFKRQKVEENLQLAFERLTIPKKLLVENLYERK